MLLLFQQYASLSYDKTQELSAPPPYQPTSPDGNEGIETIDLPSDEPQEQLEKTQSLTKKQSLKRPDPSKKDVKSRASMLRLLKTNRKKVWMFLLGSLSAAIVGAVFPSSAILFGQVLFAFTFPFDQVLGLIHLPAGIFIVLGVVIGVASFVEVRK